MRGTRPRRRALALRAYPRQLGGASGVEVPGEDGVDEHVVLGDLGGERLGEAEEAASSGVREEEARHRLLRGHGGEEDHPPPAPLPHAGYAGVGQADRRHQVELEGGRVLLFAGGGEHGGRRAARIGDEDVDRSERPLGLSDDPGGRVPLPQVGDDGNRTTAGGGADVSGLALELVLSARNHADGGAFGGKLAGDGQAEPGRGAGDESYPAAKSEVHAATPLWSRRLTSYSSFG
jgi:hypothetical protein